ncbi:MAG: twin transmembrane helix small protein [Methylocella sp.]
MSSTIAAGPNLSQKPMRWRVSVQFAVIVIIAGAFWFRG